MWERIVEKKRPGRHLDLQLWLTTTTRCGSNAIVKAMELSETTTQLDQGSHARVGFRPPQPLQPWST